MRKPQQETLAHQIEAHVDKLTPSLLAKAFRGDLVPQNPIDEPASILIDRIKQKGNTHEHPH